MRLEVLVQWRPDDTLRIESANGTAAEISICGDDWVVAVHRRGLVRAPATTEGLWYAREHLLGALSPRRRRSPGSAASRGQPDLFDDGPPLEIEAEPGDARGLASDLLQLCLRRHAERARPWLAQARARIESLDLKPPPILYSAALGARRELIHDVERFPAAALALAEMEGALRQQARGPARGSNAGCISWVESFGQWRGFFSPTGQPYRSLNRTLAGLPDHFPVWRISDLGKVSLERPVSPLHVHVLSERVRVSSARSVADDLLAIQRVPREDLAVLVDDVSRALQLKGTDADERVHAFAELLAQSPVQNRARLGPLVRHSLQALRQPRGISLGCRGYDALLALPPIPLPSVEGIEFIGRVGDLVDEGARMHHCVATYARRGLTGSSFFFHVDHQGERATIEVDARGDIVEAAGPCNADNRACRWGVAQLTSWAAGFWVVDCGGLEQRLDVAPVPETALPPDFAWVATVADALDWFLGVTAALEAKPRTEVARRTRGAVRRVAAGGGRLARNGHLLIHVDTDGRRTEHCAS
jgi:hypothetical protein